MQIYAKITKNIAELARIIADGRVVAFPTGTSYGLAVDALQGHALQRLRNLKGRDADKTFTVFAHKDLWDTYFTLSDTERDFLDANNNQPLTVLLQPKDALAHLAVDGRVGLRVIDHPGMEELSRACGVPLTATSANVAGADPCRDTACITNSFPGLLNPEDTRHGDIARAGATVYDLSLGAIYDGGQLAPSKPSTIVVFEEEMRVVRQGAFVIKKAD